MRGILHREDFGWTNAPRLGNEPSGNTTTTTNTAPWSGEEPYLTSIYSQAGNLDTSAVPQYYPGNTYAPLTGQQQGLMSNFINASDTGGGAGLQAANSNIASSLSPGYTVQTQGTFNQGNNVLGNELSSSYLDPNNSPAYATAMSNAMATALPAANASFVNGNRSDSGLAQAASTSAAANAAGGLAQQQYNTNQGIQQGAVNTASSNLLTQQGNQTRDALAAPVVDQGMMSNYMDALNTAGMGQTNNQNQLNANVAAYNYGQMLPWNQLGMEESAITGGGVPASSTTTQPYFSNTLGNIGSTATGLGSLGLLSYLALAA